MKIGTMILIAIGVVLCSLVLLVVGSGFKAGYQSGKAKTSGSASP